MAGEMVNSEFLYSNLSNLTCVKELVVQQYRGSQSEGLSELHVQHNYCKSTRQVPWVLTVTIKFYARVTCRL